MPNGTFSGSFVRISFIRGGSKELDVSMPAAIPIHLGSIVSIVYTIKKVRPLSLTLQKPKPTL